MHLHRREGRRMFLKAAIRTHAQSCCYCRIIELLCCLLLCVFIYISSGEFSILLSKDANLIDRRTAANGFTIRPPTQTSPSLPLSFPNTFLHFFLSFFLLKLFFDAFSLSLFYIFYFSTDGQVPTRTGRCYQPTSTRGRWWWSVNDGKINMEDGERLDT